TLKADDASRNLKKRFGSSSRRWERNRGSLTTPIPPVGFPINRFLNPQVERPLAKPPVNQEGPNPTKILVANSLRGRRAGDWVGWDLQRRGDPGFLTTPPNSPPVSTNVSPRAN